MFVVVNPNANGGSARRRWPAVEQALRERQPDVTVHNYDSADVAEKAIRAAIDRHEDAVVTVGGDGSVHLAVNAMMDPATDRPRDPKIALGAIGLGSSNDFHKPFGRRLADAPVKIDIAGATPVDVGKATMLLPDGSRAVRYFLLNASMGIVAEGNHSFNTAGGVTKWLKSRAVDAAILYTALSNVVRFKSLQVEIRSEGWQEDLRLANVGVLKSVHFAGGMHYDTGVTRDDGRFDVNIWATASKPAIVGLIANLYRGKFAGSKHAICRRSAAVDLRPDGPTPLELDGEIVLVECAHIEILPKALLVCA